MFVATVIVIVPTPYTNISGIVRLFLLNGNVDSRLDYTQLVWLEVIS